MEASARPTWQRAAHVSRNIHLKRVLVLAKFLSSSRSLYSRVNIFLRSSIMHRSVSIASLFLFSFAPALGFLQDTSAASGAHILTQETIDSSSDLISALDDCIQQRFLDVDQGFGFRRLVRSGETPHRFKPENAKELSIVGYLSKVKLNVVLYLAGRNLLRPGADAAEAGAGELGKLIKGPVFITGNDVRVSGPPTVSELSEQSRKAMQNFQKSDRYDFTIREWKIIARPVRASEASCLKCHHYDETGTLPQAKVEEESRRLKIGDALGVVVYAYRDGQ
jgi:hypothetical protein